MFTDVAGMIDTIIKGLLFFAVAYGLYRLFDRKPRDKK